MSNYSLLHLFFLNSDNPMYSRLLPVSSTG